MNIIVVNETKNKISVRRLENVAHHIIEFLKSKRIRNKSMLANRNELTLVFISKSKMQKINLQYREKDKPTDVLSFASQDESSLGEVVFCLDVLKKQAREQKHSLDRELLYMLIHGFLHLLEYDHEQSPAEEKSMFKLQNQCFEHLSYIKTIL